MSAQNQIGKMLASEFGFSFVEKKLTAFGERLIYQHAEGLTAALGVHRVCFYQSLIVSENFAAKSLPTLRQPRCFGADEKRSISEYVEKICGARIKIKSRKLKNPAQPNLFTIQ